MQEEYKRIALIAHDNKKADLAAWVAQNKEALAGCRLWSTATTGSKVTKIVPDLEVSMVKSGPLGGDQQIGAMIAEDKIDLLIFFTDPLTPHPHDVDVKALTRLAIVYDVPMALNVASADLILASIT